MQDIKIKSADIIFNYRVAIVIRNNNKILVQVDNQVNHITLPGGRCQLGETSIDTAVREFKEETNIDVQHVKILGIIENFFESSFSKNNIHEILIIHEVKFIDKSMYNLNIINNIEETKKSHLLYLWMSVDELNSKKLKPKVILELINTNNFQHHIIKEN
ncbi:MAG: NUDIX domain-containing protein [Firmicutes bacterium]|nr:NUDIX domain-containing protein [Bacillota bacterium]